MTLEERTRQLKKIQPQIKVRIRNACKSATERAIEKAAEMTPTRPAELKGTNTQSAGMKQHWASDSVVEPQIYGGTYITQLNNDKDYASYVNDGHRMDRHFVPGLYINPDSGLLEYDPSVGIVVGTQTPYVPGIFMTDAAKKVYQETLRSELPDLTELLK